MKLWCSRLVPRTQERDQAPLPPSTPVTGFAETVRRVVDFNADAEPSPVRAPAVIDATPAGSVSRPFPSEGPHGHRERMRDRLLERGPEGLADYELVEMLLFFAQAKGDTKPVAKRLINRFGSYSGVLCAPPKDLEKVHGVGRHSIAAIKLAHAGAVRLARAEVMNRAILGNWDQLMDYLMTAMARERIEQFRILFLDTKNQLIADELQGRGTINHTPVYPREVVRRALELYAAALILVHNHPSGDPTPSIADIEMTGQMQRILQSLDISLHDHIIIGNGRWTSLKKEGFI
jgi:DNA repair protein RadC